LPDSPPISKPSDAPFTEAYLWQMQYFKGAMEAVPPFILQIMFKMIIQLGHELENLENTNDSESKGFHMTTDIVKQVFNKWSIEYTTWTR